MSYLVVLRSLGLRPRVGGERLVVSPKEAITADARDYIRLHRSELLGLLAEEEASQVYEESRELWP